MARPSLKEVRTLEILDAFVTCVTRYGLDGSTLERISEEAGVKRPILRHYLGNREEMVALLIEHVVERFNAQTEALFANLPSERRWPALMDQLFHEEQRSPVGAAVFQALVAAADRYPAIRDGLLDCITRFEAALALEAAKAFPQAANVRCREVAAGLTAIYFNMDAIAPLQPPKTWLRTQRRAAMALLEGL